ncbi:DUF6086 family protein [Streptomyces sp. NPDC047022]|uniref:DUF6086 family protein n=1 Tax=Streptomyces sp. NPDC047022 TaxID=3155737 RepID=UPI0033FADEF9
MARVSCAAAARLGHGMHGGVVGYEFTVRGDDDEWVWAPSLRTGHVFMGAATALARVLDVPCGLAEGAVNWVKVDPVPYAAFVETALEVRDRASTGELSFLLDGVVPLMIMLADNVGVRLDADTEEKRAYVEWGPQPAVRGARASQDMTHPGPGRPDRADASAGRTP